MRLLLITIGIGVLLSTACNSVEYIEKYSPAKEVLLENLNHPWSIAFINKEEVFITEKDGALLRVNLKTKERIEIQGFPDDLFRPILIEPYKYPPRTYPTSLDGKTISGNGGILDVVLHPDFADNQDIYLSYVSQIEDTFALKVIRARVKENTLTNIRTILVPGPYVPGIWHFGGGMCIVNDQLYITVGERLFFEDLKQGLPIAQDVSDARGAIYRLNLDGSIPDDNPDLGPDAIPGIYAFGIRAAQGITHRPETDEIWFSEHGTNQGDELNVLRAGANYGWPNITSGTWRSEGYTPDSLDHPVYTDPQHYWLQTVAPTGLCFYTGTEFPNWQGNLIVPGLSSGSLWRMVLEGNTITSAEELFLNDHVRSRKVMQSPEGQLYMLTDEDNGKLIQIVN
ncbi:MAG: PQQ-dependent sugar dehydrogenase [Bacteroidota bacterium]